MDGHDEPDCEPVRPPTWEREMTTLETTTGFGIEASRELGRRLSDGARVAALREEAAAAASVLPWPDPYKERPWKYLDITGLDLAGYTPALDATASELELRESCPVTGEHATVLAQDNSETVFSEPSPAGLAVATFEDVTDAKLRALIDQHLGNVVPATASRFTAYHYAFLRGGVVVQVAANTEIDLPVRLVRSYSAAGQFAAPHTLIVTGANSRVNVIEEYHSSDGDIVAVPVVEVVAGPGSQVRYTAVHRWGAETRVFGEQSTTTERDASFIGLSLVTGGRVVKSHIRSSLSGRGSSSELYGLTLGVGNQHVDFTTVQDHIGADTRSNLLFKAALKDKARGIYYGITRVGPEGHRADANQENRNLLLSKEARADSDPVLEILTSDVIRCSHGATAGPVDEEQLYYLETRGIPHAEAEAMLVRAFLGQVLDRVPEETLRDELAAILEAKRRA